MEKCLENYTLEELKELLPQIPYYKIEIVYEYWHKPRGINAEIFSLKHNISTSTLYRYIKDIKKTIEK